MTGHGKVKALEEYESICVLIKDGKYYCKCGAEMKTHVIGALVCSRKYCPNIFDWIKGWLS